MRARAVGKKFPAILRFEPLRSNAQEAGAVKQRSGSEGENKVRDWGEKRRKPVVSPTVCSPTSDMSVCLRGRKSHAGALKSDFLGKKPNC